MGGCQYWWPGGRLLDPSVKLLNRSRPWRTVCPGASIRVVRFRVRSIKERHANGIEVSLLRTSALQAEPQLLCDMGLYGERAVGFQTFDEVGRTRRYLLRFDRHSIALAQQRWQQLGLYAESLENLLDRCA